MSLYVDPRIRTELSLVPDPNPEFLEKYLLFLEGSAAPTEGFHVHHILPRAMFPQFKSLFANPWNRAVLSYGDHFVAHYLLYRAFPLNPKARNAFRATSRNKFRELVKSSYDETLLQEAKNEYVLTQDGVFVSRDNVGYYINRRDLDLYLSKGYVRGNHSLRGSGNHRR
jgi:hypothetical protein